MQTALLLVWLVSIFTPGHPLLAKIDNENLDLISYAYMRAWDEGLNAEKFVKLIACESGWNKNAKGDYQIGTDIYKAHGILQFWQKTFLTYAKKYGLQGEYKNPYSQILLASKMLGDGEWKQWWNCSRTVKLDKDF